MSRVLVCIVCVSVSPCIFVSGYICVKICMSVYLSENHHPPQCQSGRSYPSNPFKFQSACAMVVSQGPSPKLVLLPFDCTELISSLLLLAITLVDGHSSEWLLHQLSTHQSLLINTMESEFQGSSRMPYSVPMYPQSSPLSPCLLTRWHQIPHANY